MDTPELLGNRGGDLSDCNWPTDPTPQLSSRDLLEIAHTLQPIELAHLIDVYNQPGKAWYLEQFADIARSRAAEAKAQRDPARIAYRLIASVALDYAHRHGIEN